MDEAIAKASVLIEALSYIRQFRDRHVVIKLGGSAMDEEAAIRSFLTDVVFMSTVGMRPILLHGGGKAISRAMADAGIEPNFVHGRRFTDAETLGIASKVLAGDICQNLVNEIRKQDGHAVPMNFMTQNVLIGEQLNLEVDGEPVDLGFVGQVSAIDETIIRSTCRTGTIPVIPSVAMTEAGQKLNVNADTAAAAVARIMKVEKLVFLSDVPGIFLDKDDPSTLQSHLTAARCRELIADGTIAAGMIPKIEAALEALEAGVGKVHIIDARIQHSLLLEIYSEEGIGTEIVL